MLALAVAAYVIERMRGEDARRGVEIGLGVLAAVLGALLFAGSLAGGGESSVPGLIAGPLCAALAFVGVSALFRRARRRLDAGAASLLPVYADLVALALAGLSILAPPIGLVAIVAFAYLVFAGRREGERKYEGLRILR